MHCLAVLYLESWKLYKSRFNQPTKQNIYNKNNAGTKNAKKATNNALKLQIILQP